MENNDQELNNLQSTGPADQTPPLPVVDKLPNTSSQPSSTSPPAPEKKPKNYLFMAFGILFILVIFLPNSTFAQMLAYPFWLLGLIAGSKFFSDSIKSSKGYNPMVRSFMIFGGFGVGAVIFIVCLITGAIVGFSKDPHPQSS